MEKTTLTIKELQEILNNVINDGVSEDSSVYACESPKCSDDCGIENAKKVISICSCKNNRHLVLLFDSE